jgi:hypothetical protein
MARFNLKLFTVFPFFEQFESKAPFTWVRKFKLFGDCCGCDLLKTLFGLLFWKTVEWFQVVISSWVEPAGQVWSQILETATSTLDCPLTWNLFKKSHSVSKTLNVQKKKMFLKSIFSVLALCHESPWSRIEDVSPVDFGGRRVPVADKTPWHDVDESNLLATVETCPSLYFVHQFICSSPHRWDLATNQTISVITKVTWRVIRSSDWPWFDLFASIAEPFVGCTYLLCSSDEVDIVVGLFFSLFWWRNACSIVLSLGWHSIRSARVVIAHVSFNFFKNKIF